ncbi:ATP-binding protein [Microbaculum marinum]|uniref:ATP-binding protein n=1 Tax=Microbaculum marinum TaxID=1764581 RepID=A0AAW9RK90_9HYPH
MAEQELMKIKVEPTKELFVYILTRDISHQAAIIELLDNSVDGAKRVAADATDLSEFWVEIEFDSEKFAIRDNCGGIPLQVARDYAFRFGRAEGMERIPGSIGQFGVGMKRALFSFGRKYVVESATVKDWFRLAVDLGKWMEDKDSWDFELAEYGENDGTLEIGTRIEVTDLIDDAASQFSLEHFRTRVENEIRQKHGYFIAHGLSVRVCGSAIPSHQWQLIADDQFAPEYRERTYNGSDAPVSTRIYAGVGRSNPSDAGWYVICNGRLVLGADKTEKTGWGWESAEMDAASGTPRYHNQFARFRGYVLFDCDDAGRLPWNTTKTDIDPDDTIWLDARETMAGIMRPVIDFLNLVDSESDLPEAERRLTAALAAAQTTAIADVKNQQKFRYPTSPRPPRPRTVNIQYRKEKERVETLQEAMGTTSARDTGDAAFEEAYRRHVEDE